MENETDTIQYRHFITSNRPARVWPCIYAVSVVYTGCWLLTGNMAKAPQFPFFVRNWLCSKKVASMSGDSVKAFVYLLCEAWLQESRATLPNNDRDLAEMARVTTDKWDIIKGDILRAFETGKCKEHRDRLYSELQLEWSRKYESNQRFNNKNAKRTRKNTKRTPEYANANAIDIDIDIYLSEASKALDSLLSDSEYIKEREAYHPGLNIEMTLKKAWNDFWLTEAGWKNKKAKKSKTIDWKRTANNALTQKMNQVWKPRENSANAEYENWKKEWVKGDKKNGA